MARLVYEKLFVSPFIGFLVLIISPVCLYPAVYFLYDLSPITVTIKEERRSFLHFITRLCAVLGGTFALTGLYFHSFFYRFF